MTVKINIELILQIRDDAELTAMARVIEDAQRQAWWQGFGPDWDKARFSAYMLREAGFGRVAEAKEGAEATAAVEAAAEEFLRVDREPCECRRSPFDKHTINPPCSTRREVTARIRTALGAAAPHLFAGVLELMADPEHYDSYGPSEGYVSVENLRKAIAGAA
jgi:hypothetical protein